MIDAIIQALEGAGCSVERLPFFPNPTKPTPTSTLLLVAKAGLHFLFMAKEPSTAKTPNTPTEMTWVQQWRGIVFTVESPAQALGCLGQGVDALLV